MGSDRRAWHLPGTGASVATGDGQVLDLPAQPGAGATVPASRIPEVAGLLVGRGATGRDTGMSWLTEANWRQVLVPENPVLEIVVRGTLCSYPAVRHTPRRRTPGHGDPSLTPSVPTGDRHGRPTAWVSAR